ncbi:MAG: T9SS type A sorting domain-containing protein [Bacteroidetes bacterium]|nr:T9SS type A sorting domain-containing protein [Bacteroidota bacterium]
MKKYVFLIGLFLINIYILKGQSNVNLIPNWSFEEGQDGKNPRCNSYYSVGSYNCGLNDDLVGWQIAKKDCNCWCNGGLKRGCPSPDWIDKNTCIIDKDASFIPVNPPSDRFVWMGSIGTDYHEGIRTSISHKFIANQTYTIRLKLARFGPYCKLSVHLSKFSACWNADGGNIKQKFVAQFEMDENYTEEFFYSFQKTFTVDSDKGNEMDNIIFELEDGFIAIDEVELYEQGCNESLYIENKTYTMNEAPYEASPYIVAGYDVASPPYGSGIVIVKNGADVTYKAGQEVVLEPGFEVEYGGEFEAFIAPCCPYMPTVNAGTDAEACDGSSIKLGIAGDYSSQYSWTADPTSAISYLSSTNISNPVFTPPANGCGTINYTLAVKSVCGTTGTDHIEIKYGNNVTTPILTASITSNEDDCYLSMSIGGLNNCTDKVFIEIWNWALSSKIYSYELNSGSDFECCNFDWTMPDYITKCNNYKVKVYSKNICDSQFSNVVVLDWIRNSVITIVQAPNVFTPNNDGYNDQFCFIVNGAEAYTIQIWDPNIQAYACNSSGSGSENFCVWDGFYNGFLCPDGVYYYVATFSNACQNEVQISGIVYLLANSKKIANDNQYNTQADSLKLISPLQKTNMERNESNIFLNIIPNPNNGNMQVAYEIPDNTTGTFELYDIIGKKLLSYPLYEGNNTFNISANTLENGIYFYHAIAGNKLIGADKIVIIK